jgi:hypothetical protein
MFLSWKEVLSNSFGKVASAPPGFFFAEEKPNLPRSKPGGPPSDALPKNKYYSLREVL